MEGVVRVVEKKTDFLKVVLVGEDHTVANLLAKYAIRHPDVAYAAYNIEHPLISDPVLVIRTKGRDPVEVLREVIDNVLRDLGEVEEKAKELLG